MGKCMDFPSINGYNKRKNIWKKYVKCCIPKYPYIECDRISQDCVLPVMKWRPEYARKVSILTFRIILSSSFLVLTHVFLQIPQNKHRILQYMHQNKHSWMLSCLLMTLIVFYLRAHLKIWLSQLLLIKSNKFSEVTLQSLISKMLVIASSMVSKWLKAWSSHDSIQKSLFAPEKLPLELSDGLHEIEQNLKKHLHDTISEMLESLWSSEKRNQKILKFSLQNFSLAGHIMMQVL